MLLVLLGKLKKYCFTTPGIIGPANNILQTHASPGKTNTHTHNMVFKQTTINICVTKTCYKK